MRIHWKNKDITISRQAIEFYVWSGWLRDTRDGKLREQDKNSVPYTVCLLLLAGF